MARIKISYRHIVRGILTMICGIALFVSLELAQIASCMTTLEDTHFSNPHQVAPIERIVPNVQGHVFPKPTGTRIELHARSNC